MQNVIDKIRAELKDHSDEKTATSGQNFFKEKIKLYGVKTATVFAIGRKYFKSVSDMPKSAVLDLCETLWQSGYNEEAYIACNWSYYIHKQYEPADFQRFEKWIDQYVTNWASCDTLCNHTVGTFIEKFPEYVERLKVFARSDNRWMRRAAAVSLIVPARKGLFLKQIVEIADILLLDKDDLVQKGYGWMLKTASQAHQEEVFQYVFRNKFQMPRTALRYAIEKMPKELKTKAMSR